MFARREGLLTDETVIVIKTFYRSSRPVMERASLARFPLWHVVVFAVPRRRVAVLPQDFADRNGVSRDDAVVTGKAGRLIHDNAGPHGMMIAASQQRGSCWRAECRGVEPGVAQAGFSDPVHCRCRYDASKRVRSAKADVIRHDEQNIRCILRRYRDRWSAGFGLRRIGIDLSIEGRGTGGGDDLCPLLARHPANKD